MSEMSVVVVGAGHIAGAHLSGWAQAPGSRVVGILDVSRESAQKRAEQFGIPWVVRSLDEALDRADVLDICTPPHTHAKILDRVADAGLHALVEKPVVTELTDWDELKPRLEASRGSLGVVHNLKFSLAALQTAEWVRQGRVGRVLRLRHEFLTDPATDRMLPGAHWSHELPGGRWFETLPHALYWVHSLAGPLALDHVATRRTPGAPPGVSADEVVIVLAGADLFATVHYSASCAANRRTFTVDGADGTIGVDILSDSAHLGRRRDSPMGRATGPAPAESIGRLTGALPDRSRYLTARLRKSTPHSRIIQAFAEHLLDGAPNPTPLDEIDYVVRQCDLIGREIDRRTPSPREDG